MAYLNIGDTLTKIHIFISWKEMNKIGAPQKYTYNENFFEKIDTEAKAYFLGFMMADGNVSSREDYFQICLEQTDKYILEELIKQLDSNYHLYLDRGKYCTLKVTGEKIVKDLIDLGVTPRKTHTLSFPPLDKIPINLIHHVIRGYFDGDGSIWLDKGVKSYCVQFVGTKEVLTFFKGFLGIKQQIRKVPSESVYRLSSRGNINVDEFGEKIYKDATIFLTRKHDKFIDCFNRPNKKKRRK